MTPEARFSARVKEGLKPFGCDVERIENRVNLGISDMLIGVGSDWVMMELKVVSRGQLVKLRPHQISFLARHSGKGRRCFVLVLQSGGAVLRPEKIHLYHGSAAIELAEKGLRLPALATWASRGMPWAELMCCLSSKDLP